MNGTLKHFFDEEKKQIDNRLPHIIENLNIPVQLRDAMIYSLKAGGKRIRPMLLLATLRGYNKPLSHGYDVACAIEMIHTYSLIHDDLPAMDNDDLRRGKPTNHKVFGEAMAILAGDGLLTYSFQLISSSMLLPDNVKLLLIQKMSQAAGPEGMVGGQVLDMQGEGITLSVDQLQKIHHHKTGDLLAVSVESGAILAGVSENERISLTSFAKHLGIAFQIKDDILDVEGDESSIGKPIGSDEENDKNTYPKLLGLDGAKQKLAFHISEAKKYLYETSIEHTLLEEMADYIAMRSK
nr:farnesyl diphosphate synthase [Evansella cellulosilytica]